MLKRRTSSLRSTITSPTNTHFSSSSSLSSATSTASPSPSAFDDDVQIIDVPLKSRLRERKTPLEKKKKGEKRKKKRAVGDDDDEFDEDESEAEDGNEDNVSSFSGSEAAHSEGGEEEDEDGSDEEYGRRKRATPRSQQKGGGRPVTREEILELQAVIGSHLSDSNYIQLIKNARYDVNLAANTYFAQVGTAEEKDEVKEESSSRKQNRSSPVDAGLLSPPPRAGSRSSPRFSTASTSSSASSSSPSPVLPLSSASSLLSSSSPSSSSAWPEVRKPSSQSLDDDSKADNSFSMGDSDEDSPRQVVRRGWGWGRGRARGGGGAARNGNGMKMFKGKAGKGVMFDPMAPSDAPRPADSALPAHQRMSAYSVDMDVDVKMNGKWFPMVVTNVFETGHLVEVNHRDWPPECRQMIDPVSNRLAPFESHSDEYYKFEQVDTYITAPPKPTHPDTAKYLWPGQTADEEDEEAESDLLMLLGTLQAKVVSDRPVGVKEFYDCLVCAEDGEVEQEVWTVMSTWLRKQSKLVEIEEKVEEQFKGRGQPTPALSSAQAKQLQAKLHSSREWMIMEAWQQDLRDPAQIVRSYHKDMGVDDDWKRNEAIDQTLEEYGYMSRQGGQQVLLLDKRGAGMSDSASSDSDDESMGGMSGFDDSMDSDDSDNDGFHSFPFGLLGGLPFTSSAGLARAMRKANQPPKLPKGHKPLPDYLKPEPNQRPLHTYTITMNIFLNLSAQRSSPHTTALSLTPLNPLVALLYPHSDKLVAMVSEAEGDVPEPLRDTMKLDVLMSLSVRDEEGKPMYYETFKKREAQRIKREQEEKDEKDKIKKEQEEQEAAKKKPVKRGGRRSNSRAGSARVEEKEEKKGEDSKDEKEEGKDAAEPFMDIGVGEKEEELSVQCGLTITLRDYQCTTVQWMLDQEAEESNTNMYLWTQLQFPQESLKYAGQRQLSASSSSSSASVSSSASAASAASTTVPPLFYYCPLLQRFRFKPLPNLRGGWNVEEMGLGKTIGALAVINVQRRTPTTAEILAEQDATEEKKENRREEKKQPDNSRRARYQRRQINEEVTEEKEEKYEQKDELDGEKVDDRDDFNSTSSSPSASSSSSSPPSVSSSPAALPDSMDNVDDQGRVYTSCTLVVCPVSLVGQWANELQEKSSRPLRILLYHGGNRPRKISQLLNYDVIITSYGIAASELTLGNNRAKRLIDKTPWLYKGKYGPEYQSLLNQLHWHRVILDESHVIRTMNSIQCRAAYELVGDRLWMLTGTVVNTSLLDLKGQAKFLDMKGLSVGQVWTDIDNILVQHKMYENRRADRTGKLRRTLLQKNRLKLLFVNLVTKSMIRHEKRQQFNGRPALISLPPKRVQTIMVQPTADEKRAMDEMFQHAKNRFEQYKKDNVAVRRSVEVLQLLQPLRIACSGGSVDMVMHRERMKSELDRDAVRSVMDKVREKGSLTADKVELASKAAISHLTDDCAICLDLLQEPLQTPCRHLFCAECIRGLLLSGRGAERGTGQCPLCRADLSINQLYKPNVTEEVHDEEEKEGEDDEKEAAVQVKKEPVKVLKERSGRAKKRKVVKSEDGSDEEEADEKKESASGSASSSSANADVVHFDSKLNKLMAELQAMRAASPAHKALVFTQYLSTMELLKRTMQEHDFTYQTLEGHMPMRQRKRNLEEFRSNPECAVFLLSMRSGAVGLTLTAASHVFILEPAINPALEQQAIGRIHRLGNTHREVVVNYLVMAGSVEENLMEINREKLELLEKQKAKEEARLARANGLRVLDEDEEADQNVRSAAGMDSDSEGEGGKDMAAPRFGHHHTNANADSGAGINTVSQGSLVQDVALFRIGELDKLFKTPADRAQQQQAAASQPAGKARRGKAKQ